MSKATHITQGSWFPSGYYGHFRSKSRNDFVNEYRQQAKPSPPEKFTRKLTARPTLHHFSHHDNQFSFLNTVTSFQDGLGKKKVQHQRTGKFTPDFISWVPHKQEIKEAGPVVSVYRETFRNSDKSRVPQVLVPSVRKPTKHLSASAPAFLATPYGDPADMIPDKPVTSYQISHRHMQPNPTVHTNMNTGKVDDDPVPFQKTHAYINPKIDSIYDRPKQCGSLTSLRRARTGSAPLFRSSVADCMRWHVPQDSIPPRPKTVTGTFPEVRGAETSSSEQIQQPRPPQPSGKGTVCPTTAWSTQSQPMPEQSRMDMSIDTRPMGQTHNGQMAGMDASNSSPQSASADVPMAE